MQSWIRQGALLIDYIVLEEDNRGVLVLAVVAELHKTRLYVPTRATGCLVKIYNHQCAWIFVLQSLAELARCKISSDQRKLEAEEELAGSLLSNAEWCLKGYDVHLEGCIKTYTGSHKCLSECYSADNCVTQWCIGNLRTTCIYVSNAVGCTEGILSVVRPLVNTSWMPLQAKTVRRRT